MSVWKYCDNCGEEIRPAPTIENWLYDTYECENCGGSNTTQSLKAVIAELLERIEKLENKK